MKLTSKHLMFAALAVGISLIIFAALSASLNFGLDEKMEGDISTYGMLAGFALLIWSRKKRTEEAAEERAKKEEDEEAKRAVTVEGAEKDDASEIADTGDEGKV